MEVKDKEEAALEEAFARMLLDGKAGLGSAPRVEVSSLLAAETQVGECGASSTSTSALYPPTKLDNSMGADVFDDAASSCSQDSSGAGHDDFLMVAA